MRAIRVINLTPHEITVGGLSIAPDGRVPRLREETREVGQILVDRDQIQIDGDGDTIPVTETVLGQLEGLPGPIDGVVYVVSRLVAEAAPDRDDLYFPGRLVRDKDGRVIGAASLSRLPRR